ncbi:hypothetical protein R6Q59_035586 [Mikania micrantha]
MYIMYSKVKEKNTKMEAKEKNTKMDVKELNQQELQHEHPLILIDLQVMHRDYEEDDDYDDNELLATQNFNCICNQCGKQIDWHHRYYYKCSMPSCNYSVHKFCEELPKTLQFQGLGKTEKYFKDVDYPNLLQFPLDDGSHILSYQIKEDTFAHIHHMHQTLLINESSVVSLHDPMKRIKLQCTGCSRPIIKMPFFKCSTSKCHFVLHDWCSRLPEELTNHVGHRQHTLKLYKNTKDSFAFTCRICKLICNGFSYRCNQCEYFIDINCAFIPKEITHEAHASHLLTRVDASSSHLSEIECRACRLPIDKGEIYFRCSSSYFHLDCQCALILPKTIRHKLDKHSLKFSYSPVEDHKSRYFCEICEEELDPRKWFYHCVNQCAQSIHSACAPLILESEKDVNSLYVDGVYKFINIKFGAVEKKSSCIICSGDLK